VVGCVVVAKSGAFMEVMRPHDVNSEAAVERTVFSTITHPTCLCYQWALLSSFRPLRVGQDL